MSTVRIFEESGTKQTSVIIQMDMKDAQAFITALEEYSNANKKKRRLRNLVKKLAADLPIW